MKFGMQVEDLNAFNLSSDRFLKIQNGRHYDIVTKIHGIGHNNNYVNNAWIDLKFKLWIAHVDAVPIFFYQFNIFKMAATMTSLPKITETAVARLIRKIETPK